MDLGRDRERRPVGTVRDEGGEERSLRAQQLRECERQPADVRRARLDDDKGVRDPDGFEAPAGGAKRLRRVGQAPLLQQFAVARVCGHERARRAADAGSVSQRLWRDAGQPKLRKRVERGRAEPERPHLKAEGPRQRRRGRVECLVGGSLQVEICGTYQSIAVERAGCQLIGELAQRGAFPSHKCPPHPRDTAKNLARERNLARNEPHVRGGMCGRDVGKRADERMHQECGIR